jgi:hypothetical protein
MARRYVVLAGVLLKPSSARQETPWVRPCSHREDLEHAFEALSRFRRSHFRTRPNPHQYIGR